MPRVNRCVKQALNALPLEMSFRPERESLSLLHSGETAPFSDAD
jgi:hypothetical protein